MNLNAHRAFKHEVVFLHSRQQAPEFMLSSCHYSQKWHQTNPWETAELDRLGVPLLLRTHYSMVLGPTAVKQSTCLSAVAPRLSLQRALHCLHLDGLPCVPYLASLPSVLFFLFCSLVHCLDLLLLLCKNSFSSSTPVVSKLFLQRMRQGILQLWRPHSITVFLLLLFFPQHFFFFLLFLPFFCNPLKM